MPDLKFEHTQISNFIEQGSKLLHDADEPVQAHERFCGWVSGIAGWLVEGRGDYAKAAEWLSLPQSRLVNGSGYTNDESVWHHFHESVGRRMQWFSAYLNGVEKPDRTVRQQYRTAIFNNSKRVFIVHGHDQLIKETVARLLISKDYEPIILHEQKSNGKTIIEKFEAYSDVEYAVILVTGDDEGRLKDDKNASLSPRCRQNVLGVHPLSETGN